MEGKLIKVENGYVLMVDNIMHATDNDKLSLKNCQAIENGYDLVELFDEVDESIDYQEFDFSSFKLGFKKALEILGDKKFSEKDMRRALSAGLSIGYGRQFEIENKQVEIDSYIKSLQQTEWDVEIEMWFHGTRHKKGEWIPKLDADGCLILKRK
jgi:hypothetical protein